MALSQVEDYADELNELAGQVRRNLELIGRLDEVSTPSSVIVAQRQMASILFPDFSWQAGRSEAAASSVHGSIEGTC